MLPHFYLYHFETCISPPRVGVVGRSRKKKRLAKIISMIPAAHAYKNTSLGRKTVMVYPFFAASETSRNSAASRRHPCRNRWHHSKTVAAQLRLPEKNKRDNLKYFRHVTVSTAARLPHPGPQLERYKGTSCT